jgi:hypothetical protein
MGPDETPLCPDYAQHHTSSITFDIGLHYFVVTSGTRIDSCRRGSQFKGPGFVFANLESQLEFGACSGMLSYAIMCA